MKDGYILKSNKNNEPKENEMQLINKYSRRALKSSEVYIFSVVLCDNEIDRDFECFTKSALYSLSEMYIGKTGILDHDNKSDNQSARIFSSKVEEIPERTTKYGDTYCRLVARAYMPILEKNKDLISEIDTGIKKEVSVGCAISKKYCSICGAELKDSSCNHNKGMYYEQDGQAKMCYVILDEPTDAYEWSFVAVPAQINAGVIKSKKSINNSNDMDCNTIVKQLKKSDEIYLDKEQSFKIAQYIKELESLSDVGKLYKNKLKEEIVKISSVVEPELDSEIMKSVCNRMSTEEVKAFHCLYTKKMKKFMPSVPQLFNNKQHEIDKSENIKFKI